MFYIIPVYVYLQQGSDRVTAPDSRGLKEKNNQGHAAFSAHCLAGAGYTVSVTYMKWQQNQEPSTAKPPPATHPLKNQHWPAA